MSAQQPSLLPCCAGRRPQPWGAREGCVWLRAEITSAQLEAGGPPVMERKSQAGPREIERHAQSETPALLLHLPFQLAAVRRLGEAVEAGDEACHRTAVRDTVGSVPLEPRGFRDPGPSLHVLLFPPPRRSRTP